MNLPAEVLYFWNYYDSLLILIAGLIFWFIYTVIMPKKKRAKKQLENNRKARELIELRDRESNEITKNGIVINVEDETEEYSVKKCPYCTEEINKDASKCKHCGERVGKGYEIIADGTYVANKIQGERTSGQGEVLVRHNRPMSGGQVFFRVVWITLLVIFIWVVVQLGACYALVDSIIN